MGYEKNTWRSGDVVTAEKLNHMEDGIANAWPSDLPKPSVGGYGYTEQGEQTVITWDGDTEGKVTTGDGFVKMSDSVITKEELMGAKLYSVPHGELAVEVSDLADGLYAVDEEAHAIISVGNTEFMGIQFTEGLWFSYTEDEYTSSLTYGGETVQKIDEKYLPDVGGGAIMFYVYPDDPELYKDEECTQIASYEDVLKTINKQVLIGGVYDNVFEQPIQRIYVGDGYYGFIVLRRNDDDVLDEYFYGVTGK